MVVWWQMKNKLQKPLIFMFNMSELISHHHLHVTDH